MDTFSTVLTSVAATLVLLGLCFVAHELTHLVAVYLLGYTFTGFKLWKKSFEVTFKPNAQKEDLNRIYLLPLPVCWLLCALYGFILILLSYPFALLVSSCAVIGTSMMSLGDYKIWRRKRASC